MITDAQQFIKNFEDNIASRDTTSIEVMKVTLFKKHWKESFKAMLQREAASRKEPKVDFRTKKGRDALNKTIEKFWPQVYALCMKWKKTQRGKQWKVSHVMYKRGKKEIVVFCRPKEPKPVRKKASGGGMIGKRGAGNWYKNCLTSMRRNVFDPTGYSIIFEHGMFPEVGRTRLPAKRRNSNLNYPLSDVDAEFGTHKSKGKKSVLVKGASKGSNLDTCIVNTLARMSKESSTFKTWVVERTTNFLSVKYMSKITKSKTRSALLRKHLINIVPMEATDNQNFGIGDKKDIKLYKEYIKDAKQIEFERYIQKSFKRFKNKSITALRKDKEFTGMVASSPSIFDDSDAEVDAAMDELEKVARKQMRKANARMRPDQDRLVTIKNAVDKQKKKKKKLSKQGKSSFKTLSRKPKQRRVIAKGTLKPIKAVALTKLTASERYEEISKRGAEETQDGERIRRQIENNIDDKLRARMVPPALQYRTGRFLDSIQINSVFFGPRGGIYIDFAYDEEPYGVFEIGHGKKPWATVNRDPKRFITKFIRDNLRSRVATRQRAKSAIITRSFK